MFVAQSVYLLLTSDPDLVTAVAPEFPTSFLVTIRRKAGTIDPGFSVPRRKAGTIDPSLSLASKK